MNNIETNSNYPTKKRNPFLSSFLSFISLGLGQFYNGEFLKGIFLNTAVSLSFLLLVYYNFSAYFGVSYDLVFLCLFVLVFLTLKVYSIVQAFTYSRKKGPGYRLKKFNKAYLYLVFFTVFLVVPLLLTISIRSRSLNDISAHHPFRSGKAQKDFMTLYEEKARKWPVPFESRMVETSFGKTFTRISGGKDSPPLVLLHGGGGSSLHWIPNIETLSQHFRVYAIDNIYDFGKSVYTREMKTPAHVTGWLDETLAELGLNGKVNIVGLSYGGWVTGRYVLDYPGKIRKAVLIAPFGAILPITLEWVKRGIISFLPHKNFIRSLSYWALENALNQGESYRKVIEEDVELSYYAIRCFKPKSLVNPVVFTDEELAGLAPPVLFLVGEKEKLFAPHEAVARLNKCAPQIETEIIPGVGHDLTFTRADLLNTRIIQFLLPASGK